MSRYTVYSPSRYRAITIDGQTKVQATAAMRGPAGTPGQPGKDGPEGRPGRDADVTMARMRSRRPLTRLLKSLESGTAVIAVQGDSKTAGIAVSDRSKRWQELIRDDIRGRYAPGGDQGVGVIQCYNFADNYLKPQPTIGGDRADDGSKDWAYIADGLGYQSVQLDTNKSVVTFPERSVRYLRVHWTRRSEGGKFVVKNGNAEVGTIDTAGQAGEQWTDYDLGSVASRTLTITQTEGHPRVSGLVYRTATTGVTVIDAAHSGARADEYANKPLNVQAVQAWSPSVLVIALGANDLSSKSTADGMADSLKQHLGQHWDVNPKMAVLFVFSPPRWQNVDPQDPDYDPTRWAKVRSEIGSAIGDDPRVQIWDESSFYMPGPDSQGLKDPWDLTVFNDAVHYQDLGNRILADGIMREAFTSDNGDPRAVNAVQRSGDSMTGNLDLSNGDGRFIGGAMADKFATALSVMRNGNEVGTLDNNGTALRVWSRTNSLQLRGPGNNGISINGNGDAAIAGNVSAAGGAFTSGVTVKPTATNVIAMDLQAPSGGQSPLVVRDTGGGKAFEVLVGGQIVTRTYPLFTTTVMIGSGSSQVGGGGSGCIGIANTSKAPTSAPSNGLVLYAEGGNTLRVMGSDGKRYQISMTEV